MDFLTRVKYKMNIKIPIVYMFCSKCDYYDCLNYISPKKDEIFDFEEKNGQKIFYLYDISLLPQDCFVTMKQIYTNKNPSMKCKIISIYSKYDNKSRNYHIKDIQYMNIHN